MCATVQFAPPYWGASRPPGGRGESSHGVCARVVLQGNITYAQKLTDGQEETCGVGPVQCSMHLCRSTVRARWSARRWSGAVQCNLSIDRSARPPSGRRRPAMARARPAQAHRPSRLGLIISCARRAASWPRPPATARTYPRRTSAPPLLGDHLCRPPTHQLGALHCTCTCTQTMTQC